MPRQIYEKTHEDGWKNQPDKTTPVMAEDLDHIEQGIYDNSSNMALKEIYGDSALSMGRRENTAIGTNSLAFGQSVEASAQGACAVNLSTIAKAIGAHAQNVNTKALAFASSAEGFFTQANGQYQHVQGKYNELDETGKFAHIVGGGNSDTDRKNIHTLDWQGNTEYTGTVKSAGLKLTDTETGQEYMLTIANENLEITAVE